MIPFHNSQSQARHGGQHPLRPHNDFIHRTPFFPPQQPPFPTPAQQFEHMNHPSDPFPKHQQRHEQPSTNPPPRPHSQLARPASGPGPSRTPRPSQQQQQQPPAAPAPPAGPQQPLNPQMARIPIPSGPQPPLPVGPQPMPPRPTHPPIRGAPAVAQPPPQAESSQHSAAIPRSVLPLFCLSFIHIPTHPALRHYSARARASCDSSSSAASSQAKQKWSVPSLLAPPLSHSLFCSETPTCMVERSN